MFIPEYFRRLDYNRGLGLEAKMLSEVKGTGVCRCSESSGRGDFSLAAHQHFQQLQQ